MFCSTRPDGSARRLPDCACHGHQIASAVLPPRRLVVSGRARPLLAVAHRLDARSIQPEADQVPLCGVGTPLAQGQVVLLGAALVAVALDARAEVWALPRLIVEGLQRRPGVRAQLGAVEVEVDAGGHDLDGARSGRRYRSRRW